MIKVPENKIRIVAPEVGGRVRFQTQSLCRRGSVQSSGDAALGAPIKWIETRREKRFPPPFMAAIRSAITKWR